MPKETLLHIMIFYISLFCIIKSQNSKAIIKEIYPHYYNTTATFISLPNSDIKKYAYFSFDITDKNIKDTVYFKITTDSALYHSNINYYLFEKEIDKISGKDVEGIYYYFIKGANFRKEKTEQGYDSYLKFEHLNRYNRKTLLIRIDVEKMKGDISIENLEKYPEDNSLINNNNYNKNNYNNNNKNNYNNYNKNNYGHHDYDRYNNHHHEVINNEQRYYNNQDNYNRYYHYHKEWRYHSHDRINEYSSFKILYGIVLLQVWFVIMILYCLVNRKKRNNQIVVGINNNI